MIFFARYEASQFGSPYIETEHMLLGLLREDPRILEQVSGAGGSLDEIRKKVEDQSSPRKKISTSVDLPLSNESRRILAYAAEEAERLGHGHIGTEHLLLGTFREKGCMAAKILSGYGIQIDNARASAAAGPTKGPHEGFYCPRCAQDVTDPLTCQDCSAVICRQCGTPLEVPDDLAMG
ncbi:MAG: Clp protease N-terminal domain-containing protein [Terriglobales bacterium]